MKVAAIILMIASFTPLLAQQKSLSLEQLLDHALERNGALTAARLEVDAKKASRKTSFDLPKTEVSLLIGQYNSFARDENNLTVTQSVPFTAFGAQGRLVKSQHALTQANQKATENQIIFEVRRAYYRLVYAHARQQLLLRQDSVYTGFLKAASLRYETGEANALEHAAARSRAGESGNQLGKNRAFIRSLLAQLRTLGNLDSLPVMEIPRLSRLPSAHLLDTAGYRSSPSLTFARSAADVAAAERGFQRARNAPDLLVGFFSQTLIGTTDPETGKVATASDRFTGFQVGVALPLWFVPFAARAKAATLEMMSASATAEYRSSELKSTLLGAIAELNAASSSLDYYEQTALTNAQLIFRQADIAFRAGEIGYVEYLTAVRDAVGIEEGYLATLNDFNQIVIEIEYLTGKYNEN